MGGEDTVEIVRGKIEKPSASRDAGIVDSHIQPPRRSDHVGNGRIDGHPVGKLHGTGPGRNTQFLDFIRRTHGDVETAACHQPDGGTQLGERKTDRATDAFPRPVTNTTLPARVRAGMLMELAGKFAPSSFAGD